MLMKSNDRYNTLSAALHILDPEGVFVPGTKEYNWIEGSLLSWMAEMEPENVLNNAVSARDTLKILTRTVP